MTTHFDTVIVGGAALGSATAYFLSENRDYDGSIAVIEPDPTYRQAATSLSGSSIRHQFSNPVNIALSQFGSEFMADFHRNVEVDGEAPSLGFRDTGYLFLATAAGCEALTANHEVHRSAGVAVRLLDPEELRTRFPFLNTDDIVAASLGERNEGTLDAYSLMRGLRGRARHNGVPYLADTVVGFDQSPAGRITGVRLASGSRLTCRYVVNCAGTRAAEVAGLAGVALPVEPRKRCVFVFDSRVPIEDPLPLVIDPSGVWIRREPPFYMAGMPPPDDSAVAYDDFAVDHTLFEDAIWPVLAHRIPAFQALGLKQAWAGHYAYNTLDQNAVVGPAAPVDNLLLANGFSGHGLQHAVGVGRGIGELITYGRYRTIDLSRLGYDRVARGEPFYERAVI